MSARSPWLQRIGLGCGGLIGAVALFAFAGYALPRDFSGSAERTVPHPCAEVFPKFTSVAGVQAWWEPVLQIGADQGYGTMTVIPLPGMPTEGPGTKLAFMSGETRMETWTLTSVTADHAVWDVDFAGMLVVHRTLAVAPDGAGCHVTWSETADISNPLMRWFSLMSDPAENFEGALQALD